MNFLFLAAIIALLVIYLATSATATASVSSLLGTAGPGSAPPGPATNLPNIDVSTAAPLPTFATTAAAKKEEEASRLTWYAWFGIVLAVVVAFVGGAMLIYSTYKTGGIKNKDKIIAVLENARERLGNKKKYSINDSAHELRLTETINELKRNVKNIKDFTHSEYVKNYEDIDKLLGRPPLERKLSLELKD